MNLEVEDMKINIPLTREIFLIILAELKNMSILTINLWKLKLKTKLFYLKSKVDILSIELLMITH